MHLCDATGLNDGNSMPLRDGDVTEPMGSVRPTGPTRGVVERDEGRPIQLQQILQGRTDRRKIDFGKASSPVFLEDPIKLVHGYAESVVKGIFPSSSRTQKRPVGVYGFLTGVSGQVFDGYCAETVRPVN